MTEERVSEYEDMLIENVQPKEHKEKHLKKEN